MPRSIAIFSALVAGLTLVGIAPAEEADQLFTKKIRPLLESKCFDCHSAKAEEVKGGLKLDTLEEILKGGPNGPAVVPGDVENSFLLKAIRYQEADYQMPPAGKLSDEQIQLFEQWVKAMSAAK
ncbi:c-type cytochrome domain-containing protein [Anatilimnocola sp. NA78]|uniref:c-type cytochrome domain-containing protein n=1 Tax=Anatilimnocola sp. NA78 TaxID=3415683 RepID=UPI003CE4DE64